VLTGGTCSGGGEESGSLASWETGQCDGGFMNNNSHRDVAVGMAGTFDIENYGDLLFPVIAAAALKRRDQRIRVVPFSLNGKSETSWPFRVWPMEEMSASLFTLSVMLIGGGQLIRFDNSYPVAVPANANKPIAYWLVPAVQAALAGKPVIWNAVGAWTGSPRARGHDELVRQVLAVSYFVGVQDVVSRGVPRVESANLT
jgi:hypothetical protein